MHSAIFLLLMLLLNIPAVAQETTDALPVLIESVKTYSGEIAIRCDQQQCKYTLSLNGKVILKTDCKAAGDWKIGVFALYSYLPGEAGELVILEQSSGGNACVGSYRFLTIKRNGRHTISQSLGNCNFPTITCSLDKVIIQFPSGRTRRGDYIAPQAYAYSAGRLEPVKLPDVAKPR
jgi:hypothetical protein